jgi:hypothetical protein
MQLSALRHHNNINCCLVIDETRLLIGCDDALLCCDLDIHSYHRLTNSKRIQQLSYSPSEQLVVSLAGKQRQIKVSLGFVSIFSKILSFLSRCQALTPLVTESVYN